MAQNTNTSQPKQGGVAKQMALQGLASGANAAGRVKDRLKPQWDPRPTGRKWINKWKHTYSDANFKEWRAEFNQTHKLLEKAANWNHKVNFKFALNSNNPLAVYQDAHKKTHATFTDKAPPKKGEDAKEDTDAEKAARKAAKEDYEKFMESVVVSGKNGDKRLASSTKLLGDKLTTIAEKQPYDVASTTKALHKMSIASLEHIDKHAEASLAAKKARTTAYFDQLIDSVKPESLGPADPKDPKSYSKVVQNLVTIGKITLPQKDTDKSVKDQLESLRDEQIKDLSKQSEANKKKAAETAENIANAYYRDISDQARLGHLLQMQDAQAIAAAEEDVQLRIGQQGAGDQNINPSISFLEKVAEKQGNILKGPMGTEIKYENGTFTAQLDKSMTKQQKQGMIDFHTQALFAAHGDSVAFTMTSQAKDPVTQVKDVEEGIRMQVRAVAAMDGKSLDKQTFHGVRLSTDASGNQVAVPCVYSNKPDAQKGELRLDSLFKAKPQELVTLRAVDKVNSRSAKEKFIETKDTLQQAKKAATTTPAPDQQATQTPGTHQ